MTTWYHTITIVTANIKVLLRPRPSSRCVVCYLHNPHWIGLLVMPILEVRKLKLRNIIELHQGYVWRRKWQPTPVFLPGESQGRGSLVGRRLWGRTESDTTKAT